MPATLSSVAHALQVLRLLRARGPLRLTDVASSLDLSPSTAHRLLATLKSERFVEQDPESRTYVLGPAMLFTSSASAIEHCALVAGPIMRRLRDLVDETVHLTILKGTESIFVAAVESSKTVRVTSRVGQHPRAHSTAAGKVLLAQLSSTQLTELYAAEDLHPETSASIPTLTLLADELRRTRSRGYGLNLGESEVDMFAVAVPIERPRGEVTCALSVAAPLSRVDRRLDDRSDGAARHAEELLAPLEAARVDVESRLGF